MLQFAMNTSTSSTPLDFHLSTVPSSPGTTLPWKLVFYETLADKFFWYTHIVTYPIMGVLWILGSIFSGIVLKKNGLDQTSNILLFALAIADACCLLGGFNIGFILLGIPGRGLPSFKLLWKFSYTASHVSYVIFMVSLFISSIGSRVSAYITVLITVERSIAVFFPLRFHSIVTPRRVWLAIAVITLLWLPWISFQMTWHRFVYGQFWLPYFDAYYGSFGYASHYYIGNQIEIDIVNHFTHLIPLVIVSIGSTIISLKIGIALRKRQKLTQSESETKHSTSRTNKTLLMVCLVFSVTRCYYYLQYLPWLNPDNITGGDGEDNEWFVFATIYSMFKPFWSYLNSAVNFLIYVGINKKFRKTFKGLLGFTKPKAGTKCCR